MDKKIIPWELFHLLKKEWKIKSEGRGRLHGSVETQKLRPFS